MSANSKQDLLDELAKGDSMRRWGAVLALGRDAVNRGLQSNFVEAFTDSGVLQPISGEFYIDPGTRTEKVAFENLTLGPTQLSFQGASGSGPQVRVRMELIAGNCVSSTFMIGNVNRLRRSHALEMGMGYQFEVYGRLKVQAHEHLDRSLVVLDLSEADKWMHAGMKRRLFTMSTIGLSTRYCLMDRWCTVTTPRMPRAICRR